ncbi:MAG: NAD(P)/FAD-dependent oxidoreductase [Pseudomonadota bacterium]
MIDVIIIGGGAAGLMCACTTAAAGKSVLVLEGSNKIGKKILMSGGGRCNFTNLYCDPDYFLSANPHFCKSALSRYTQWDFIALVEKHKIDYHEKTLGQLFCDHSSKDIVAMLREECEQHNVRILTHCDISGVTHNDHFVVESNLGQFSAPNLVIATGGLSIPKMGATDFGYRIAQQFGHQVLPTRAGLVPFTFTGALHELMQSLSGVSLRAAVTAAEQHFIEGLLFTHRGLSGPAALQASSYWKPGASIAIDTLPEQDATDWLLTAKRSRPRQQLATALADALPRAAVSALLAHWQIDESSRLADLADRMLSELGDRLNTWSIKPAATEGYRTAEVTLGGIDTNELSSQTMESQHQPGLYFIGEVVDVTGHLGGFNFQWAWSSAVAAATALSVQ